MAGPAGISGIGDVATDGRYVLLKFPVCELSKEIDNQNQVNQK